MINSVICLWFVQGVLAAFQGRLLYQYALMNGPYDIKRIILNLLLLYMSEAVSMAVLLVVFEGKKLLRFTGHAFWVTIIFPAIATIVADFFYIRTTGRFLRGFACLLLASLAYLAAGIGFSLLLVRIFGHRAFRPGNLLMANRKKHRARTKPEASNENQCSQGKQTEEGSSQSHDTGWNSSCANQENEASSRTYRTGRTYSGFYHKGEANSEAHHAEEGFSERSGSYRAGEKSPEDNQAEKASHKVIIPDYRQEYIEKAIPKDIAFHSLQSVHDRAIYYGGSSNQLMVGYIDKNDIILQAEKNQYGARRLGCIGPDGKFYELSGKNEKLIGHITPAGYVKNAVGLEVGYVDEEGRVFRYEGVGVRDMTHAKTLIGRVNPGDLEAGAALILFFKSDE